MTQFDPKSLRVSDLMTSAPATADEGLSLSDAQARMFHNKIRHLVVTRGNLTVVGVVSQRDLALAMSLSDSGTVAQAMSSHPFTCTPDLSLLEVATEMEAHRYGCAIVMDGGKPVGMFTTTDALRAVRSLISGKIVEPLLSPTHNVDPSDNRPSAERQTTVGRAAGRGAKPSPNIGNLT